MKYNININQKALIELVNDKFDTLDAVILNFLIDFCGSDNKKIERLTQTEDGIEYNYTWVNQQMILKELPLLRLKQTDSISTRLRKIEEAKFIRLLTLPGIDKKQGGTRTYVRLTEKVLLLEFDNMPSGKTDNLISSNLLPFQFKLNDNNINDNTNNDNIYVHSVFSLYKEKILKGAKLTDEGKRKIKSRLKIYTVENLLKAIENFSNHWWWMENNAFRGVAWFFHSDDRIEQFIHLKPEKKDESNIQKVTSYVKNGKN